MLTMGSLYKALIMLICVPSIPTFFGAFNIKGCWIFFQSSLLHLLRWPGDFCPLLCFCAIEPSLHYWTETSFIMVYSLFDVFLNSVCEYFIKNFLPMFIKETGLQFSFFLSFSFLLFLLHPYPPCESG
jgi:hypothetical protein